MRPLLGLLVAGVALLLTALAAPAYGATTKVTFGVQPATAGHPDSRPNLSYGVTPGSTVLDHVAIVNFSAVPLTLSVYATDAVNTSGGGFGLLDGSQRPQDAGAWTSIDGHAGGDHVTVHVPARHHSGPGFVVLPLAMHVPVGANPGDHVGGVVAVLSTVGKNAQGANVRLDQRVATRLFVRVSGTSRPLLTVTHVNATYHPGDGTLGHGAVTVSYTVHNGGNVSLGAQESVRVAGLFGVGATTVQAPDTPLLLPGTSLRETVRVPGILPLIHVSAVVTLHPTHPVGAVDPGLAAAIVARGGAWAFPWAPLLLLVLLSTATVLLWRRHRRLTWQRRHRVGAHAPARRPQLALARLLQRQGESS